MALKLLLDENLRDDAVIYGTTPFGAASYSIKPVGRIHLTSSESETQVRRR